MANKLNFNVDLVTRLRQMAPDSIGNEAADEIERLHTHSNCWLSIATLPHDLFEPFDVWSATQGRISDCVNGVTTYGNVRGIVYQSDYDCDGPVMTLIEDATHWMQILPPYISE